MFRKRTFNFLAPGTVPLGRGCYGVSEGIVINKGRYYAYHNNSIEGCSTASEAMAREMYNRAIKGDKNEMLNLR